MLPPQNEWDKSNRNPTTLTRQNFRKLLKTQAQRRAEDYFYDLAVFQKLDGKMVAGVSLMEVARGVFHNAYLVTPCRIVTGG